MSSTMRCTRCSRQTRPSVDMKGFSRRVLLERTLAALALVSFTPRLAVSASGYRVFNADEAVFIETLVRLLCPADRLTPDGVACGLASFIDRALDGDRRRRDFTAGMAAASAACEARYGMGFDRLSAADSRKCFNDTAA